MRYVLLFALIACVSCTTTPEPFTTIPAVTTPAIGLTCSVSSERIRDHHVEAESRTLWDFPAIVIDNGSTWRATDRFGLLASPQLYHGSTNRIDGSVNYSTGERFYRVNFPVRIYNYSKVGSDGDGVGRTYYDCK